MNAVIKAHKHRVRGLLSLPDGVSRANHWPTRAVAAIPKPAVGIYDSDSA